MRSLNLGILAHVDAGKTSLTERLLHAAGAIDDLGRVDDGDTRTDTLALERRRGITIKSAVTSFRVRDTAVNLIDTPGHPDFIAEVERVLAVLDAVVLVVSAVEGVQAQTRILMRALQRLRIPVLIFVNKIDRAGARPEALLPEISDRLRIRTVPLGRVEGAGDRSAHYLPYALDDRTSGAALADVLTESDDRLLADYLTADGELPPARLTAELARQTAASRVHPVIFGSAATGAGVGDVLSALADFLPGQQPLTTAAPAALVFKIERDRSGQKICYLRVDRGVLHARAVVPVMRPDGSQASEEKITKITVFDSAEEMDADWIAAGQIGKVAGLPGARIGDLVGAGARPESEQHYFTPPSLETVVDPVDELDRGQLRSALDQLSEQDPLINLRQAAAGAQLSMSLYGEVQKEVIESTLESDFGLRVRFSESTTICVERPIGTGEAVEYLGDPDNPFLATVGLRVEPGTVGSGVTYGMETVVHGTMPPAFFTAVEETVASAARQGLCGWQLIDCRVTLTHTGYAPRQSHAHQGFNKAMSSTGADFRDLTPLVLMAALQRAGSVVLEPIHRFSIELPGDQVAGLYPVLARHRAIPQAPSPRGDSVIMEGDIPAAEVHGLELELPGLSRGEAVLECSFDRYQRLAGKPFRRARTDNNPLNRREYLLRTTRGKGALV